MRSSAKTVGATVIRLEALDVEFNLNAECHVAGISRRYVLRAGRESTLKGPIQREESSDCGGSGVCSKSSSTLSPTANKTSRRIGADERPAPLCVGPDEPAATRAPRPSRLHPAHQMRSGLA